jgi:hypothetical protein
MWFGTWVNPPISNGGPNSVAFCRNGIRTGLKWLKNARGGDYLPHPLCGGWDSICGCMDPPPTHPPTKVHLHTKNSVVTGLGECERSS